MVLPLYLAISPVEIRHCSKIPLHPAWLGCHFSAHTPGLSDISQGVPQGGMLIVDDRISFTNHDPDRIVEELTEAADRLDPDSILLDFERPSTPAARELASRLADALPCPVGSPPGYRDQGPVFPPPCPLHVPLEDYLEPWKGREIWLDAAVQREIITVTSQGTTYTPAEKLPASGYLDPLLLCRYTAQQAAGRVTFTLFDTSQTLSQKLELAGALGVTRAIGLYQEIHSLDKK